MNKIRCGTHNPRHKDMVVQRKVNGTNGVRLNPIVGKNYSFMTMLADNGQAIAGEIEFQVRNNCCGSVEWIKRSTFFRRITYNAGCRSCQTPGVKKKNQEKDKSHYTKLCGGGAEGWGLFLASPFGRCNDSIRGGIRLLPGDDHFVTIEGCAILTGSELRLLKVMNKIREPLTREEVASVVLGSR